MTTPLVLHGPLGVVLRQFTAKDARPLFDLIERNREHLSQFGELTSIKYRAFEAVLESITQPRYPNRLRFGIWAQECLVGTINISPTKVWEAEVGYWVGRQYAGKGYARWALWALEEWAYQHTALVRLTAVVHKQNLASQKTLGRSGFNVEFEECNTYYCEKRFIRAAKT